MAYQLNVLVYVSDRFSSDGLRLTCGCQNKNNMNIKKQLFLLKQSWTT